MIPELSIEEKQNLLIREMHDSSVGDRFRQNADLPRNACRLPQVLGHKLIENKDIGQKSVSSQFHRFSVHGELGGRDG